MVERTGMGDPVRVLTLLWRKGLKAGRKGVTLDQLLDGAVELADRDGLEQLTMRKIGDQLGVGTMTLYAYVPGKAELIDLMVDYVHANVRYPPWEEPPAWRSDLEVVAEANWSMLSTHPWLLDIDTTRPPLGPGTIAKYDAELRAVAGTGLADIEIDQLLSLVLEHVRASARLALFRQAPLIDGRSDSEWWEEVGPLLAAYVNADRYPLASRIGTAAGQEYGTTVDPHRTYRFGLERILDGVDVLIAQERAERPTTPPP